MDRRTLVTSGLTAAGATMAASVLGSGRASAMDFEAPTPMQRAAAAAAACVKAGEACVAHCINELGRGHTQMANCNKRVHEMLATCRAMLSLASMKSELAAKLAATCADACKLCADACAEHRDHWSHGMHLACKACFDACVECEAACRGIAA